MAVEINEVIEKAWNGYCEFDRNELSFKEGDFSTGLMKEGIVVFDKGGRVGFCRYDKAPESAPRGCDHEYLMPEFGNEILALLKSCMDGKSVNILLTGYAGTGKSEFVHNIAARAGFGRIFQVNGRNDMDSSDFYGDKTVTVDPVSKQNFIEFKKGPLYEAFIEGTELDADGNQVLYDESGKVTTDGSGSPRVIGKPGLFFLDEFAALMSGVFLSVFNRAMEIPSRQGASRSIEITTDGDRVVKSHPGFAMFLAGNTVGKGTESSGQMGFTAQDNQMDDSTLDRITATYEFGYNLQAERNIAEVKLGDDREVGNILRFRDEIRKQWVNSNVETLLSTRAIVQICELARVLRDGNMKNYVPLAVYRSVFTGLREREKQAWNETIRMIYGVDVVREFGRNSANMFYAERI